MAYDVESNRMVLFGGAIDAAHPLTDTWTYELSTNAWRQMAPAESPGAVEGPMVYDVQSDRVIMFVGVLSRNPFSDSIPASETWAYDLNTDTWTNRHPAEHPPAGLLGARMAYDSESDKMILFGGWDFLATVLTSKQTWAYDFDTNTWKNMAPKVSPPGRNFHQMAYDSKSDRVIMWGGSGDTGETDDNRVWAYDFNTNTWAEANPPNGPICAYYVAMTYVPGLDQLILFGGQPASGKTSNNTWAYSYKTQTWTQLNPSNAPPARAWHAMVYSTAADKLIMFGGGRDRYHYTDETWIYDPIANIWTNATPNH